MAGRPGGIGRVREAGRESGSGMGEGGRRLVRNRRDMGLGELICYDDWRRRDAPRATGQC